MSYKNKRWNDYYWQEKEDADFRRGCKRLVIAACLLGGATLLILFA